MKKDSNTEVREFAPEQFELVNKDLTSKIHDEKFKTKPTTFTRDALKRFAKNKSSVVAACIIGTLLLGSIIIPIVSSEDLTTVKIYQSKLQPKLFDAGTGWWDGTKTYKNLIQDRRLVGDKYVLPAGGPDDQAYKENAILKMTVSDLEEVSIYIHSDYAFGGYLVSLQDAIPGGVSPSDKPIYLKNYTSFQLNAADAVKATVVLGDQQDLLSAKAAEQYRFVLLKDSFGTEEVVANLTEWAPRQEVNELDLSAAIEAKGLATVQKAKLAIQGLPVAADGVTQSYISVKSVEFSFADTTDETIAKTLEEISFKDRSDEEVVEAHRQGITLSDANAVAAYEKNKNICYWQTNGGRYCYGAQVRKVNVLYDDYEHVFGNRNMTMGGTELQKYIDNGWCKFEGITSKMINTPMTPNFLEEHPFVILDEAKCPVVSLENPTCILKSGEYLWQFDSTVTYYKYLGLSKAPRYLVGTDKEGYDLLTRCFSSLKTSLLVAIICVAVCLVIGLVWGSISGYFGGTVDLVMERITDIMAGLPSIVLMTLLLILIGRNIYVFALSVVITGWIGTASLTRTQFYRFRDREYVLASRTLGASDARLIFRHILPNGLGTIITNSVLRVPSFIASEATIAYLGIGLKTTDSFGVVLSGNQRFVETYPYLIVFPAAILALLMISFNLFGNGLRDAVNPTLKGGE